MLLPWCSVCIHYWSKCAAHLRSERSSSTRWTLLRTWESGRTGLRIETNFGLSISTVRQLMSTTREVQKPLVRTRARCFQQTSCSDGAEQRTSRTSPITCLESIVTRVIDSVFPGYFVQEELSEACLYQKNLGPKELTRERIQKKTNVGTCSTLMRETWHRMTKKTLCSGCVWEQHRWCFSHHAHLVGDAWVTRRNRPRLVLMVASQRWRQPSLENRRCKTNRNRRSVGIKWPPSRSLVIWNYLVCPSDANDLEKSGKWTEEQVAVVRVFDAIFTARVSDQQLSWCRVKPCLVDPCHERAFGRMRTRPRDRQTWHVEDT